MNILLIEDDKFYRTALEKQLNNMGHKIQSAGNGIEALEIIDSKKKFHAVISDIIMPQLSGPSFILSLRRRYSENLPQIIFISTLKDGEEFVNKLGIPYNHFLSKPVDPELLAQVLSTIKISSENKK